MERTHSCLLTAAQYCSVLLTSTPLHTASLLTSYHCTHPCLPSAPCSPRSLHFRQGPCQHNYCLACFKRWLAQGKKTCPTCRAAFPAKFIDNPRINTLLTYAIRQAKQGIRADTCVWQIWRRAAHMHAQTHTHTSMCASIDTRTHTHTHTRIPPAPIARACAVHLAHTHASLTSPDPPKRSRLNVPCAPDAPMLPPVASW